VGLEIETAVGRHCRLALILTLAAAADTAKL
jgi:hypothetical protein